MPLTAFQQSVLRLLARNRTPDSYLAGGAALHFAPNSLADQGILAHCGSPGGVLPQPSGTPIAPREV